MAVLGNCQCSMAAKLDEVRSLQTKQVCVARAECASGWRLRLRRVTDESWISLSQLSALPPRYVSPRAFPPRPRTASGTHNRLLTLQRLRSLTTQRPTRTAHTHGPPSHLPHHHDAGRSSPSLDVLPVALRAALLHSVPCGTALPHPAQQQQQPAPAAAPQRPACSSPGGKRRGQDRRGGGASLLPDLAAGASEGPGGAGAVLSPLPPSPEAPPAPALRPQMKRAADSGDLWDSEAAGTATKVRARAVPGPSEALCIWRGAL
jgi:hypothetical protein